jgi:hypothetical protein
MKKYVAFASLILIVSIGLYSDLLTAYKKGVIKLVPDATFGAKTSWDMYFLPVMDKSLAFFPDGSFFKTAFKDGKIYRFSEIGEKVSDFGRVGQGPGDLNRPVSVDILDGNNLIVNDSGNSRVCVFDMAGNFINQFRTDYSISSLMALKDGKVLIVGLDKKSDFFSKLYRVLIRDLSTGAEKEITSFKDEKPQSSVYIGNAYFEGTVHIARIGNDRFLAAYSKGRDVELFTFAGERISSFKIDIPQEKITFDHFEYVIKPDPKNKVQMDGYQRVIVANKDKIRLPEFHQFYLGLTVDPDEHIILFLNNLPRLSRDISFQVYSLDGKLMATVNVDQGEFKVLNLESLLFHGKYLYASLEKKDAEGSQVLARVKISE